MILGTLLLCSPLSGSLSAPPLSPQDDEAVQQALAEAASDVITRKCMPCHAPGSTDKKALRDWDCADDLAASLELEHLIVPGDSEGSDLFLTVDFGDMPPPLWEGGPCTDEEREALRAWIDGGAPLLEEEAAEPAPTDIEEVVESQRSPWRTWLGKLHPPIVHFPIALLLAAVLADFLRQRSTARFCLILGTASAFLAGVLGWLAGETIPETSQEALDSHRWTGVTLAVFSLIVTILHLRKVGEDGRSPGWLKFMLLVMAVLVGLAGHWGGEFVWGEGYLNPPF